MGSLLDQYRRTGTTNTAITGPSYTPTRVKAAALSPQTMTREITAIQNRTPYRAPATTSYQAPASVANTWANTGLASNPGSGYTAGGGGGSVAPQGPTGPAGGGGGGAPTTIAGASSNALQAQIDALQAQYGMTLAELAAAGGEIGARAAFLMKQLNMTQFQAEDQAIGNKLQRGVFRSGMTARDLAKISQEFAGRKSEVQFNAVQQLNELARKGGRSAAETQAAIAALMAEIQGGNTQAELGQLAAGEKPNPAGVKAS